MVRYPPEETAAKHQRILAEASRLLRERGLDGVSVGELMQAAGLTHGGFYNHFGSKPDMIAECVDHVCTQATNQIRSAPRTGRGKVAFIRRYLGLAARDSPGTACLMPSLSAEIGREPAARSALSSYVRRFVDTLARHFPWLGPDRARGDAIRLTASLVGAMVLARAVDDDALSREILREVIARESEAAAASDQPN